MGEDYDFPDGGDPRYPSRWGISMKLSSIGGSIDSPLGSNRCKKLDFIIGTHVHSDHIGGADRNTQSISSR